MDDPSSKTLLPICVQAFGIVLHELRDSSPLSRALLKRVYYGLLRSLISVLISGSIVHRTA